MTCPFVFVFLSYLNLHFGPKTHEPKLWSSPNISPQNLKSHHSNFITINLFPNFYFQTIEVWYHIEYKKNFLMLYKYKLFLILKTYFKAVRILLNPKWTIFGFRCLSLQEEIYIKIITFISTLNGKKKSFLFFTFIIILFLYILIIFLPFKPFFKYFYLTI